MNYLSFIQIGIFLIIVLALILQQRLIKAGNFKKVTYSTERQLPIAISVSAPLILASYFTQSFVMFVVAIVLGFTCYVRKSWYVWKG